MNWLDLPQPVGANSPSIRPGHCGREASEYNPNVPAKWALTAVDQLAPDMAANAIGIQTK